MSIGLPVYNGERYLEAALRSLASQTYGDFELIISDNCSTDRTADMCRDLAATDPRVRYARTERNLGANPNFNRVLDLAQGEYFRWAAYDDLCAPTYLQRCVEALDADPTAALAHTCTTVIDEAGRPIDCQPAALAALGVRPDEVADAPRALDAPSPARRFTEVMLRTRWCFEIFGLMRTAPLRRTGGHGLFYGSDKVILAMMCLQGRFVEVPEALFLRRHHNSQSSMLASPAQRAAWSGVARTRGRLDAQVRCLAGYRRAIAMAPLTATQRLACYGALARYLAQPDKWAAATGLKRFRHIDLSQASPAPLTTTTSNA